MKKMILIGALTVAANAVIADDEPGWSGQGELGFVSARGNSETETLNVGANATYNLDRWRHSFDIYALRAENDGDATAERFGLGGQSDLKINDISYWFGSLRYESDEFSQYDSQATAAAGYGRTLWDSTVHKLVGEAGIGVRRSKLRLTGDNETDPVVRGALNYLWTISETAKLSNDTLVEAGDDNTFASNITALTTKVYQDIGIKLGYEIRHNTDVDEPLENSDRLTTINLVYDF